MPLLRPDVLIAGEGTSIVWLSRPLVDDGASAVVASPDAAWEARLEQHWDLGRVQAACAAHDERTLPEGWPPGHTLNGDDRFRHAITLADRERAKRAAAAIAASLNTGALGEPRPHYDVSCVTGGSWFPGWIVTVLPAAAGKANAAEWVREKLAYPASRAVWAGDSDNDISMMSTPMSGIVVGNANAELLEAVRQHDEAQGKGENEHLGTVYKASAHNAAGVLEGLEYCGFSGSDSLSSGLTGRLELLGGGSGGGFL